MSFWQIFKNFGTNSRGDVINLVSDNTFVSPRSTTYTQVGNIIIGSNGSQFVQVGGATDDGMGGRAGSRSMTGGLDARPAMWVKTDGMDSGFGKRSCFDDGNDDKW
jgi:hypothetical protein